MKQFLLILCLSISLDSKALYPIDFKVEKSEIKSISNEINIYNNSTEIVSFYYYDLNHQQIRFHIRPKNFYNISTHKNIFIIQSNKYQNFYLLKPNDSLTIDLSESGFAIIKSTLYPERNEELLFSVNMNLALPNNFWTINQYIQKFQNTNYNFLDSLFQLYYVQKINFTNSLAVSNVLSDDFIRYIKQYFIAQLLSSKLYYIGIESKAKVKEPYHSHLFSFKDSILNHNSTGENEWLNRTALNYIKYVAKRQATRKYQDSALYSIAEKLFEGRIRSEVLFLILSENINVNKHSSVKIIKDYLTKYGNQDYNNYLESYLENQQLLGSSNKGDSVITITKEKISFAELVKKNRGSLIYIDVWASWCIPCRNEMPAAAKIRERFKNDNIVFFYISIDDNFSSWSKANIDEKLEQADGSFLLVNFNSSEFKRKYLVTTIPRYILIGKNGELVNINAPRPSNTELVKLIKRNL